MSQQQIQYLKNLLLSNSTVLRFMLSCDVNDSLRRDSIINPERTNESEYDYVPRGDYIHLVNKTELSDLIRYLALIGTASWFAQTVESLSSQYSKM